MNPEVRAMQARIQLASAQLQALLNCDGFGYAPVRKSNDNPTFYASLEPNGLFASLPLVALLTPCQLKDSEPVASSYLAEVENDKAIQQNAVNAETSTDPILDQFKNIFMLSNGQKIKLKNGASLESGSTESLLRVKINGEVLEYVPLTRLTDGKFAYFYKKAFNDSKKTDCLQKVACNTDDKNCISIATSQYLPLCKEGLLDEQYFELDRSGHKFYEHLKGSPIFAGNEQLIGEIDDLIEEIITLGDFEKYIKIVKAPKDYTLADLQSLKASLEDIKQIQLTIGDGKVDKSVFGNIWKFLKALLDCQPASNAGCVVTDNIVPRCIWDNNLPFPTNLSLAWSSGIIDGAYSTLVGLIDFGKLVAKAHCWIELASGLPILFAVDPTCRTERQQVISAFKGLKEFIYADDLKTAFSATINKVSTTTMAALGSVGSEIGSTISTWLSDVSCYDALTQDNVNSSCCAHTQGKLIFDIAATLFGVEELKAIATGAKWAEVFGSMAAKGAGALKGITALGNSAVKLVRTPALATALLFNVGGTEAKGLLVSMVKNGQTVEKQLVLSSVKNEALNTTEKALAKEIEQITASHSIEAAKVVDQAGNQVLSEVKDAVVHIKDVNNIVVSLRDAATGLFKASILIVAGIAKKIEDDGNSDCNYCGKTISKPNTIAGTEYELCQKVNELKLKGGSNGTDGVSKLCGAFPTEVGLRPIVEKLLTLQNSEIQAFLGDITKTYTSAEALNKNSNLALLNTDLIDAWKVVYDARNTITSPGGTTRQAHRSDMAVLREIVKISNNAPYGANFMRLEGISGMQTYMRQNTRLPCNPCYAYSNGDHLNDLENYLQDLVYLSNTCSNSIIGCSSVTAALKSTAAPYYRVEPEAFVIRVLRSELWANKVVAFEASMPNSSRVIDVRINDNGTTVNCEFKSWGIAATDEVGYEDGEGVDISKSPFDNLVAGKGSYGQFRDYLKGIASMSELRYYFDAKKGVSETYAKEQFQKLMYDGKKLTTQGTEIFNTIWGNTTLRGNLFPNISDPVAGKDKFEELIESTSSIFYNFIKVK